MTAIAHRRLLARRLTHRGREYQTVIVEISADGLSIDITPFERETASTPYENRPLRTKQAPDGHWRLDVLDKQPDNTISLSKTIP